MKKLHNKTKEEWINEIENEFIGDMTDDEKLVVDLIVEAYGT